MARKPKEPTKVKSAARAKKSEAEEAPAIKMISAKKLNALIGEKRAAYKEQRSISGELGAAIKEASENENLHKKAFAIVSGLDRLEPEPLADLLAHLDFYLEASGLRKRAGSVVRMNFEDDGKEPGEQTTNVSKFPAPRGEAAE